MLTLRIKPPKLLYILYPRHVIRETDLGTASLVQARLSAGLIAGLMEATSNRGPVAGVCPQAAARESSIKPQRASVSHHHTPHPGSTIRAEVRG